MPVAPGDTNSEREAAQSSGVAPCATHADGAPPQSTLVAPGATARRAHVAARLHPMKVAILAGGTGGTKLAHGFAMLGDEVELELTAIANVGDDAEFYGLHVSPDIDALL